MYAKKYIDDYNSDKQKVTKKYLFINQINKILQ